MTVSQTSLKLRSGSWTVAAGRYGVVPEIDADGVSTLRIADPLPADSKSQPCMNADDVTTGRLSNGLVIFDYQSPTDFKFAGAYVGSNRWLIGHRTSSLWVGGPNLTADDSAWCRLRPACGH